MRVLIVGGGVAGLMLAARLGRQRGRRIVVAERAPSYGDVGYALALWPLGTASLHGVGLYDDVRERSVTAERYELRSDSDELMQSLDLADLAGRSGPMLTLSRADLIDTLRTAVSEIADLRLGLTLRGLEDHGDEIAVTFTDGTREVFDVVVGCDGAQSALRPYVSTTHDTFDAGFTIWTWWGEPAVRPELGREWWGREWFAGTYPTAGRTMWVIGVPGDISGDHADSAARVRDVVHARTSGAAGATDVLAALRAAERVFTWPMSDVRVSSWRRGRLVLCGDAAVSFLPTAGVGASNALRGAAALAYELSLADPRSVPVALERFERRCRPLVERNQRDSRMLARAMFLSNGRFTALRDRAFSHVPASVMLRNITRSMRAPF